MLSEGSSSAAPGSAKDLRHAATYPETPTLDVGERTMAPVFWDAG